MRLARFLCCFVVLQPALALAQTNPVPFLNQPLVPASVAPGGAGFVLTVNGTGFVSGSVVDWNGSPRVTTFVSSSQLRAAILNTDIATAMTASVTVVSPGPGGGASNVVPMPVRNPASFVSLNASDFGVANPTYLALSSDLNGDNKQDLATVFSNKNGSGISILLSKGDGTFDQGVEIQLSGIAADGVRVGDLNRDGKKDLVIANGNHSLVVLLGNGDGTFQPFVEYSAPNQLVDVSVSDFNRDGNNDVVALWVNGVCTFLGNGDGTFQPVSCSRVSNTQDFSSLTAADLNRDGILDVVLAGVGNAVDNVSILLGKGDGTFQDAHDYSVPTSTYCPVAADLNADGIPDIAVVGGDNGTVLVFRGNGDGSFQTPSLLPAPASSVCMSVADINGDGKLDFVVSNYGFSAAPVSTFLGNGDGTFQDRSDFGENLGAGLFAVADFNNDGRIDVGMPNGNSNTFSVLLQDDGSFVKLSATALAFPTQLVNTVSDPKFVTLTNTGITPVTVSKVGTTANFSVLSRCHVIQPAGSCKIGVFFAPTVAGDLPGYLSITDDGGGSPQSVSLVGKATVVSFSPRSLDFGNWAVGRVSKPQDVVLTNEGNTSLSITGIQVRGQNARDFSEISACPTKLPAGTSCTIRVLFHPSAQGARSAVLGVNDSGGASPQFVGLAGNGT